LRSKGWQIDFPDLPPSWFSSPSILHQKGNNVGEDVKYEAILTIAPRFFDTPSLIHSLFGPRMLYNT
jgi:hypothetical protein